MEKTGLELTAYHEASHAVVAHVLNQQIDKIEIFVGKDIVEGMTFFDLQSNGRTEWQLVKEKVLINCAGSAGIFLLTGWKSWSGCKGDHDNATLDLKWLQGSKNEIRACLDVLWNFTKNMLAKPENWYVVTLLAEFFNRTIKDSQQEPLYMEDGYGDVYSLDGKAVEEIFNNAIEEYRRQQNAWTPVTDAWQTEEPEITFLKRVCFHESSHALIQYLRGYKLTGITINPVERYGKCSHDWRPDIGLEIQSWRISEIEMDVLEFCAGAVGEAILTGTTGFKEWDHQSADYRHAVEVLTPICEDEEEIATYLELMWARCETVLSRPENWKAVVELTTALIWRTENDDKQERSEEDVSSENYPETGRGYREMAGSEIEEIIRYAFNKDAHTYDN